MYLGVRLEKAVLCSCGSHGSHGPTNNRDVKSRKKPERKEWHKRAPERQSGKTNNGSRQLYRKRPDK